VSKVINFTLTTTLKFAPISVNSKLSCLALSLQLTGVRSDSLLYFSVSDVSDLLS